MSFREIRTGRAVAIGLGLCLGLALLPTASAQAQEFAGVRKNVKAGQVKGFWTPERLRAARPLPAPEVSLDQLADLDAALDEAVLGDTGGVSFEGSRPLPGIRPQRSSPLFDPADASLAPAIEEDAGAEEIADRASGSGGALFTSHRLIPEAADLWYPYSTVGKIFFTIPGKSGTFYCSAAVIRLRIVITAGGCVHAGKSPGFYNNFLFVPAYRDGNDPFSSWEWSYVVVPSTWSQGGGTLPNAADYALIEVEDQIYNGVLRKIGQVTGTLGYATKKLKPNHATILGYSSNFDGGEQLHQVSAKDFKATSTATSSIEYGSDMRGGSQGGPLLQDFGDNSGLVKLIGVLSYYQTSTSTKTQGASIPDTRFTSLLASACGNQPGNC
ncbi:MAG TPA: trypsin-like serine protease [Thermoanaerobaculia bacterium]|nr:trypsin-like serine protease [Thermoanaerobaculia bacterium]